jgi:hypothetical protein
MNSLTVDIVLIANSHGEPLLMVNSIGEFVDTMNAKVIQRGVEIPLAYTKTELKKMAREMVMKSNNELLQIREQNKALQAELKKLKGEQNGNRN